MGQSLQSMLEDQVTNLEHLAHLLDQELHLISSRDAEALMKLLQDKEQALEDIQHLDNAVNKQYQAVAKEDGISEDVNSLITSAQKLLEQCKYRTQINQKAVEQGQLRLTHLRNLMLEVRAKESLTYDKSGKPKGSALGKGISA